MALAKSFGSLLEDPLVPIVWKPKAREICLGWNDYGGGWYGHNAKFRGDSIVLRFCQEKQIAIAIVARQEHAAYVTLGSLFGRHLDEFCAMYVPKQLTAEEWTKVDASCFIGRFENAAMAYLVDMAADKALKVGVHQKSSPTITTNEPLIKRRLRAAADQVFYSVPADHALLPFVQFFGLADGKYQYLFSNQQIFPRIR
jgi:hypothetical protein